MSITAERKTELIHNHARTEGDTGSAEVQVAILSERIANLTELGFGVAVGIIIAAYGMAPVLVPGLSVLEGHGFWWPGHARALPAADSGRSGAVDGQPAAASAGSAHPASAPSPDDTPDETGEKIG